MQIQGTSALVSGGASGLGEATVRRLTDKGATCTIFDRDEARAKALADELGGGTSYVAGDVSDPEAVGAAVEAAGAGAPLRIAVNCAGIGWAGRVIDRHNNPHDLDLFKTVINVNLIGTFNVIRLAAAAIAQTEALEDGERGVIVNTASIAAFDGQIGQAAYAASKGGVVSLTLPVARELARFGIRVVTIAPGIFETPMMASFTAEVQDALGKSVPFPARLGRPAEFAALVKHICENTMLNGETIRLDGALRMAAR
jgi:NAD(P)-dependent dehydrogenase (short-subunit alcohol dehydrogenase family)